MKVSPVSRSSVRIARTRVVGSSLSSMRTRFGMSCLRPAAAEETIAAFRAPGSGESYEGVTFWAHADSARNREAMLSAGAPGMRKGSGCAYAMTFIAA